VARLALVLLVAGCALCGTATAQEGITAANVRSLVRQQVAIDGTVDAAAIYLRGVFFVTTTYGKTLAIDAASGAIRWEYTPSEYSSWAGSYRMTTATPVADPDRAHLYAASPDGRVQKLAVRDGRVVWSTAITSLPRREKIASPLKYFRGHVIATTGGYIGDASPYQGHVAVVDGASGKLLHVWNSLCSDRPGLLDPASCSASGSAIWGRAGAVIDSTTGSIFVATGNGPWDGRSDWGDAVLELDSSATQLLGNYTPVNTAELEASDADLGSTSPVLLGGNLIVQGGKDGSIKLLDWPGHPIGRGSLHGARGAARRDGDVALRRRQRRHRGLDARRRRAAPTVAQRELRHEPRCRRRSLVRVRPGRRTPRVRPGDRA